MSENGELMKAEIVDADALAILNKSEIDQQIATAKTYPRSIERAQRMIRTLATQSQDVAMSCMYTLKRSGQDGKPRNIIGPSVRFAEILVASYGNIRAASRIIKEEQRFVTAQGLCHDLESNSAISVEVRRRITTSKGRRYGDDMIGVTGMAAMAIAYRNAVFKVVPRALWEQFFNEARGVAAGQRETIAKRRVALFDHFAKLGVSKDRILASVGVVGEADIGVDEIITIGGLANAIKDGELTILQAFPDPDAKPEQPRTLDDVAIEIEADTEADPQ